MNKSNRLTWQRFTDGLSRRGNIPLQSTTLDDCLLCATHNFFVIVGTGAFVPGYLLIVTKAPRGSLAEISKAHSRELGWLVQLMSELIQKQYSKQIIYFEHGMCSCIDAENAHLHLMPVSLEATLADFQIAINQVLDHRGIGITDYIDRELRREFRSQESNLEVLTFEKLPQLASVNYPQLPPNLGRYVYFKSSFSEASFLTNTDLGSQVGREIVFEVEKKYSKELEKMLRTESNLITHSQLLWRWQDFSFSENIVRTVNDLAEPLEKLQNISANNKYGFKSYVKPRKTELEQPISTYPVSASLPA